MKEYLMSISLSLCKSQSHATEMAKVAQFSEVSVFKQL